MAIHVLTHNVSTNERIWRARSALLGHGAEMYSWRGRPAFWRTSSRPQDPRYRGTTIPGCISECNNYMQKLANRDHAYSNTPYFHFFYLKCVCNGSLTWDIMPLGFRWSVVYIMAVSSRLRWSSELLSKSWLMSITRSFVAQIAKLYTQKELICKWQAHT